MVYHLTAYIFCYYLMQFCPVKNEKKNILVSKILKIWSSKYAIREKLLLRENL